MRATSIQLKVKRLLHQSTRTRVSAEVTYPQRLIIRVNPELNADEFHQDPLVINYVQYIP